MEINEYTVEKLVDPTGLLEGERYEFRLYITLEEDDELYSESGTGVRAILAIEDESERIVVAHFFERETDNVLDFELEEEELQEILEFCKSNLDVDE